jgi:hypothetical protein
MDKPKNPAAVTLGRAGGKKRAENMTKADRSASAKTAAAARWAKFREGNLSIGQTDERSEVKPGR